VLVLALALHLHLHLRHHFHGPPLDYTALALGCFASWVGLPGPGEPLLIAAGVLAAKHKLSIDETLLVAFVAATAGGIVGWLIGLKAGRALLVRPGPFQAARLHALERGDEVFVRWPALAVLMTFSWMAGINRARTGVYMLWNAVGAALWAGGIGIGAYFAGPPVVHIVDDEGWVSVVGIVGLVAVGVALEIARRRHLRAAHGNSS